MTKQEILEALYRESKAVTPAQLARTLHCQVNYFHKQLVRLLGQGLVTRNNKNRFSLTDFGRNVASSLDSSYHRFSHFGLSACRNKHQLRATVDYIWMNGNLFDLRWVWKGLMEMQVKPRPARRWWNRWRLYLHQPVPEEMAEIFNPPHRDYIISRDNEPVYVGEALSDLEYEDAVSLAETRKAARANVGAPIQPKVSPEMVTKVLCYLLELKRQSIAEEKKEVLHDFKKFQGDKDGRSYVARWGGECYIFDEFKEGKSALTPTPEGSKAPPRSWYVDHEGNVQEIVPGKQLVIKQAPAALPAPKTFIVKQTPEGIVTEEYEVGKPIIISNLSSPLYSRPTYANMEETLEWIGSQAGQRRNKELQEELIELGKNLVSIFYFLRGGSE